MGSAAVAKKGIATHQLSLRLSDWDILTQLYLAIPAKSRVDKSMRVIGASHRIAKPRNARTIASAVLDFHHHDHNPHNPQSSSTSISPVPPKHTLPPLER